jgi:hypothetical protein
MADSSSIVARTSPFTNASRIQDLIADSVDQMYETMRVNLNNFWRGYRLRHPFQPHMHGEHAIPNYADWLLASFGNGIGGGRIEYLQGMNWR